MTNKKLTIGNTALLVIDIVNGCCHPECEIEKWNVSFQKIRKMVPKLKTFIRRYKKAGGNVIFINCLPWTKNFLPENLIELYKDPKCRYYSSDKSGFEEDFFGIKPEKDDPIISKNTYDAFSNPELDKILKKRKIKHVIISGVFGDGCVESSIQGGFSAGHNLIILKDLIETTDIKIRQKLQKSLKEFTWPIMFGKTINSKDLFKIIKEKKKTVRHSKVQ